MDRWNQREAESALAAGKTLLEALSLGLPFADQLLRIANGDEDQLQNLWLGAVQVEMGGPTANELEMGAQSVQVYIPTTLTDKDVAERMDSILTFLKEGMRKNHNNSNKKDRNRRRLEKAYSYLRPEGDNGWP
jgi:hypothetical protein